MVDASLVVQWGKQGRLCEIRLEDSKGRSQLALLIINNLLDGSNLQISEEQRRTPTGLYLLKSPVPQYYPPH